MAQPYLDTKLEMNSYKCWVEEEWDPEDAIKVDTFLGPDGAAEKFVQEDLYDRGYFEWGLEESNPIRVCVLKLDGTLTKWDVTGSYYPSFSAREAKEESSEVAGKQEPEHCTATS